MSDTIFGQIDRFPWASLPIIGTNDSRTVPSLVDTGFDGELAVTSSIASWLGDVTEFRTVVFANGQVERRGVIPCRIGWGEVARQVNAMVIDGDNSLIGIELLDDHRLTVEFFAGREVTIERIE